MVRKGYSSVGGIEFPASVWRSGKNQGRVAKNGYATLRTARPQEERGWVCFAELLTPTVHGKLLGRMVFCRSLSFGRSWPTMPTQCTRIMAENTRQCKMWIFCNAFTVLDGRPHTLKCNRVFKTFWKWSKTHTFHFNVNHEGFGTRQAIWFLCKALYGVSQKHWIKKVLVPSFAEKKCPASVLLRIKVLQKINFFKYRENNTIHVEFLSILVQKLLALFLVYKIN